MVSRMTRKSLVVIFQTLEPMQSQWPLQPQQPRWPQCDLYSLISTTTKKNYWSWWLDPPWCQNDQYWSLFKEWIIKNPVFFTDIWYPFCWRLLRPAYITFLKNGYKCQNVITSGICRTHYIYEIIYLDTCQSQITLPISIWDTLYLFFSVRNPNFRI